MNLELRNIGLIEQGELELNGITLIAAENDAGKSTIGKALFSLLFSTNNFKKRFLKDLKKRVRDNFLLYSYLSLSKNGFKDKNYKKLKKIEEDFIKITEKNLSNNCIVLEEFETIFSEMTIIIKELEEKCKEEIDVYKSLFTKNKRLEIKDLKEILNYDEIVKTVFQDSFEEEFETGISNIFSGFKDSYIKFKDDKEEIIEVNFNDSKIKNYKFKADVIGKYNVIYIESPILLDYLDEINKSENSEKMSTPPAKVEVLKEAIKVEKKLDMIDKMLEGNKNYNEILKKIKSEVSGDLEYDKNVDKIIFKKFGKNINVKNIATGIKSFGMLEILLKNNRLDSNTILVIDEPEVHLHPKWQIKYAEFLILISKELGVKILLNSHSPYFIRALDIYGKEHEFQDFIKFYTLLQNTNKISTKITELNGDLSSIFKLLMEPYETFEKILAKSDKDD